MIIGISGHIGSGKDTIGRIIQYFTDDTVNKTIYPYVKFNEWVKIGFINDNFDWKIVKFADTLKDIICLLTGCTRAQLEDEDFKNSKLPDEWAFYGFGEITASLYSVVKIDYLSTQCNTILDNGIDINSKYICKPTYRELLQYIGTDLLRNQLHENVWVNGLFSKYKPKVCSGVTHCALAGKPEISCNLCPEYPNWIITDCRFENEAEAIKDKGGIIIRVNREDITGQNKLNPHTSETALDDYEFDYVIDNYDTITELILRVKEVLQIEKII